MTNKQLLTVGNPNSGKTTLFNRLTGSRQAIGNWAGVTVDKKTGVMRLNGKHTLLTDLPGIYTLDNADGENSLDESIAVNALFSVAADFIINVVDASSLERSLYLTLQLRELGRPMILVLNKMDVSELHGYCIDTVLLAKALDCEVLTVTATSPKSVALFREQLSNRKPEMAPPALHIDYGHLIESAIAAISVILEQNAVPFQRANAIRLLANDGMLRNQFDLACRVKIDAVITTLARHIDIDLTIANVRYSQIARICQTSNVRVRPLKTRITDAIDDVVLHRLFGLPIFFAVMYVMFMFSINVGSAFIDFFDMLSAAIFVDGVHYLLDPYLPLWLMTLVADGVGGGIQTVATFIPVIACLYLFMSVLESSGYMARAAFVLDKAMQKIGLPGKAFVPLVLGFGCNVPAIMATRTLEKERERRLAAAMAPFMSCGARLPVFALFAAAFFPENGQNVVFLLYLLGIVVAIFTGLVLRNTLYPGDSNSMLMEMPRYEWPRLKDVVLKTWHKLKRFVLGAGKIIIVMVTVLSFLNSVGRDGSFGHQHSEQSVLASVAKVITPIFAPIGIQEHNWQATVGIITGIFAKEALVGTLNSLYSRPESATTAAYHLGDRVTAALQTIPDNLFGIRFDDPLSLDVGDLDDKQRVAQEQGVDVTIFSNLNANFTVAGAFSYLVFVLLYTPCVAAIGAYVKEFGRAYAGFIASWTMLLAVVVATLCYQTMMLTVTPITSALWMLTMLSILAGVIISLKLFAKKNNCLMAELL